MSAKKYLWIIPITAIYLTVIACGQFTIGVIPPTATIAEIDKSDPKVLSPNSPDQTDFPDSSQQTGENALTIETEPGSAIPTIAYIGLDHNLWLLESGSKDPIQITSDGILNDADIGTISYSSPRFSSDGTLLAYRRLVSKPNGENFENIHALWVLNLTNGDRQILLAKRPGGFTWKPNTHQLAYGIGADIDYYMNLGSPDAELPDAIFLVDLDTGETRELVAPERGYAIYPHNWSPDGRFLSFSENMNMEGSGNFAYYDLERQEYVYWDEAIGNESWSKDGELITYSRQTYAATGEERLYLRSRLGEEKLIGPDYDGPAYATEPIYSPVENKIAYLAFLEGPESYLATIMVYDLDTDEAKPLGQFEDVWQLDWLPDGSHIVFSYGHWESRQIVALNVENGNLTKLAEGDQPAIAGK